MQKKTKNNDFKIIAIQPNTVCKEEIAKVLLQEDIYYFYNDYRIEDNRIKHEPSYPNNLYDWGKTNINISAIAGHNGAGKSTIVELLFMAINNIAFHFKIKDDLELVLGLKVTIYFQLGDYYKLVIDEDKIFFYKYSKDGLLSDKEEILTKKNLFYTIGINYSHYAYNIAEYSSTEQQDWLSALFHKNDGYQTPLVINPWRENGDIKIDRENELVRSRLLANLLRPDSNSTVDFRQITVNLSATRLVLTPNIDKIKHGEIYKKYTQTPDTKRVITTISLENLGNINKEKVLRKINKAYNFNYNKYRLAADELEQLAMDYLIRKLISISIKYEDYYGYFLEENDDFDWEKLDGYIKLIIGDSSHIGFKFKQTLNYLKYKHINLQPNNLELTSLANEIQKVIDKKKAHKLKVIELIPPPIFTADIILKPIIGEEKDIWFRTLSSGEKQMVYSISSILYHLVNLDSVTRPTKRKIKYRHINIILEEIELYFHPELQRNYLKLLRESIINLGLESILTINICFVTHSPFILSDIPNSNVMFLKIIDGKAKQVNRNEKTFGANIHDLLADGFFMHNGVCGAFAVERINQAIKFLNTHKKIKEIDDELIKIGVGKSTELKLKRQELWDQIKDENKDDYQMFINMIGEPIIATKLSDMYNEIFPQDKEALIRDEISRLQKLLNK